MHTQRLVKLSRGQRRQYNFMVGYMLKNHNLPTSKEISIALGFKSENSAHENIKVLARKGWLEKLPLSQKYRFTQIRLTYES